MDGRSGVQRALRQGAARALRVLCEERVEPTVAAADTRRIRAALATAPSAAIEPLVDCLALLLAHTGSNTPVYPLTNRNQRGFGLCGQKGWVKVRVGLRYP
jgi:hypothetical protein